MIARYTLVILAIFAVALFFWQIKEALLAAFAGVIVAVVITGMARGVRWLYPMSRTWSLVSVGIIVVAVIGLMAWGFGAQIITEFRQLLQELPGKITEVQQTIQEWPMGEELLDGGEGEGEGDQSAEGDQDQDSGAPLEGEAGGLVFEAGSTLVDVLSTIVIILFIGIFFAINPDLYKRGVVMMFPKHRTEHVAYALDATGDALWQWLMGQLIAMAFVGAIVTTGLLIIGVPLALILGLIAGLLEFIPFLGPIIAFIPALLLAFSDGPQTALFTALLYLFVQQVEGNVITPIIQQKMVSLPPAVVILAVVAFGLVFGVPGVILATPLAVVAMVLIRILYLEDVLGKEMEIPGENGNK